MILIKNLKQLFEEFNILQNENIKLEIFGENVDFLENNDSLNVYTYKQENQINELFLVHSISTPINSLKLKNLVEIYKSYLLGYFNFQSEVKKLYYNTYLIVVTTSEIINDNHILNEILLDKEVMRKIIIQKDSEFTFNLLPFLDNKLSNLDKSNSFISEENLNSLISQKKSIENTSLDDIFTKIQTKIEKGIYE